MQTRKRARFLIKGVGVAAVAALGLAMTPDQLGAASYTATAKGDLGSIILTGSIASSITLDITAGTNTDTNFQCNAATALSTTNATDDTVAFGAMYFNCSPCGVNGACYVASSTEARYVATLNATLTFSGLATAGLEIYQAAAAPIGTTTVFPATSVLYTTAVADWRTAGTQVPAAAGGGADLIAAANATSPAGPVAHQLGVSVTDGDAPGAYSAEIIYRTL